MKKLIIIAVGLLAIGATSCQKDVETKPILEESKIQVNTSDSTSIDKGNIGTWD